MSKDSKNENDLDGSVIEKTEPKTKKTSHVQGHIIKR